MGLEAATIEEDVPTLESNLEEDQQQKQPNSLNQNRLTKAEVKALDSGKITASDLIAKREQARQAAQAEITQFAQNSTINLQEYKNYKEQIESEESAEKMQMLLEQIKDIPKQKENIKAKEAEEAQEVEFENPKIQEYVKKAKAVINQNREALGEKAAKEYEKWYIEQIKDKPSVGNAKKTLDSMVSHRKEGIEPRVTFYKELSAYYKKFGISSPQESRFCRAEGMSEKTDYLANAKQLETHFEQLKKLGLYTKEVIDKEMQDILTADNLSEQKDHIQEAKKVSRAEQEGLTVVRSSYVTIAGKYRIRAMSEKSEKAMLKDQSTRGLREPGPYGLTRLQIAQGWKNYPEYGKTQAKDLEKALDGHPDLLDLVVDQFGKADEEERNNLTEKYKKLAKETKEKTDLKKKVLLTDLDSRIDSCDCYSKQTKERYKKFFKDEENYKNEKTGEKGDLEALEKMYKIYISPTPDEKSRNQAAYEKRHANYNKEVDGLLKINENIDPTEIKKWRDDYQKMGWKDRLKQEDKLKQEIAKQKREAVKRKEEEATVGITENEKSEAKEINLELKEVLKAASEMLLVENKPKETIKLLNLALVNNPEYADNAQFSDLLALAWARNRDSIQQKEEQEAMEDRIAEKVAQKLQEGSKKLETDRLVLEEINLRHSEQGEVSKHKTADKRREEEALQKVKGDQQKEALVRDYLEQTDAAHSFNAETDTGEEREEIKFGQETTATAQEVQKLKDKTKEQQAEGRIAQKKEFNHFDAKDGKTGKIIDLKEARKKLEADKDAHIDEITEEVVANEQTKAAGSTKVENNFADFTTKLARERARRALAEQEAEVLK